MLISPLRTFAFKLDERFTELASCIYRLYAEVCTAICLFVVSFTRSRLFNLRLYNLEASSITFEKFSSDRFTRLMATSIQSIFVLSSLLLDFDELFELVDELLDFDDDELLLPPDVNLLFVPLANAVPPAKAFPRLKILPFLSKASDCLWLNTIAFLGISTNSAPCVPTVHHLPV